MKPYLPISLALFLWLNICGCSKSVLETAIVKEIVDGDTLKVQMLNEQQPCYYSTDSEGLVYIRLLGIDAPESSSRENELKEDNEAWEQAYEEHNKEFDAGQMTTCSGQAAEYLSYIIDKEVTLYKDGAEPDIDMYFRPLRYVEFEGEDLSLCLAREGYAVRYDETECSLCEKCEEIYQEMLNSHGCLWEE
ncbi:thermonuclease family protein [archaeon]|nr:thermonuclease family protein [archaeon]